MHGVARPPRAWYDLVRRPKTPRLCAIDAISSLACYSAASAAPVATDAARTAALVMGAARQEKRKAVTRAGGPNGQSKHVQCCKRSALIWHSFTALRRYQKHLPLTPLKRQGRSPHRSPVLFSISDVFSLCSPRFEWSQMRCRMPLRGVATAGP